MKRYWAWPDGYSGGDRVSKRETVALIRERERSETRESRARSRRQLKCFWTWPFGHYYDDGHCVNCGAYRQMY